jgi:hypothetical protein
MKNSTKFYLVGLLAFIPLVASIALKMYFESIVCVFIGLVAILLANYFDLSETKAFKDKKLSENLKRTF